jgi:hypothetical protein
MTDAEHAERTALVSVFPEADILMCFFNVVKAAKDKLSGNKDRDVILKDISLLHMYRWIVNSTTFYVYFQMQWVEGPFHDWNVFSSAAGVQLLIHCIKSFDATLRRCFMEWKQCKVGKCSSLSKFYYLYLFKNLS